MRELISSIAAICSVALSGGPAAAGWDYQPGEDALDDRPVATIAADDETGRYGFGLKCWKGGETQLRLMTAVPWGDGSAWPPLIKTDFRADKEPVTMLLLASADMAGRLSLAAAAEAAEFIESDVGYVVRALARSKQRLVFALKGQIVTFRTGKAASAATEKLVARCGLSLADPDAPADSAPKAP